MTNTHTLKTLEGLTRLTEKVAIYVPSTFETNKNIDSSEYVRMVENTLSHLFGGCTAQTVMGGWISEEKGLVNENITIVYSYVDKLNNEKIDNVLSICEWLKDEMKQECISLEINNELYFV